MANPHFQNQILWAGNTVASKAKKDTPMFLPVASDQTFYCYSNDFFSFNSGDWTITTTEAGTGSATEAVTSGLRNRTIAKDLVSSRFRLPFEEACQEWLSRVEGLAGWYGRIAGIRETAVVPRPRPTQRHERDEEDVRLDKITAEIRQLLKEEKY